MWTFFGASQEPWNFTFIRDNRVARSDLTRLRSLPWTFFRISNDTKRWPEFNRQYFRQVSRTSNEAIFRSALKRESLLLAPSHFSNTFQTPIKKNKQQLFIVKQSNTQFSNLFKKNYFQFYSHLLSFWIQSVKLDHKLFRWKRWRKRNDENYNFCYFPCFVF